MPPDTEILLDKLALIVGAARVLTKPQDTEGYQRDWRDRYRGTALAVVLPANVSEVGALVQLCCDMNVPIVPQGAIPA